MPAYLGFMLESAKILFLQNRLGATCQTRLFKVKEYWAFLNMFLILYSCSDEVKYSKFSSFRS